MKALAKLKAEPGIWMTDIPEPTFSHNDVLIKIKKTGICGTDIHIYNWDEWAQKTVPVPLTIGHEFCGEVVAVGCEVTGFKPGDRVSGEGHLTCGHCRSCRAGKRHICSNVRGIGYHKTGCFAEYFVMPASNVFLLPDAISDDIAAILDPFGNATHAALSFDLVDEDILITGAGPVGIMATSVARHVGARHIIVTDINEYRLDLARKMGATCAVNVKHESLQDIMNKIGMKAGFDVGIEMSGNPIAFNDMLEKMHHGGNVALLGIPPTQCAIDWNQVIFKMLTIKGIYGREIFETWYKMTGMLQNGLNIDPVITHHFPVSEFQAAFDVMRSGHSGKVILEWT